MPLVVDLFAGTGGATVAAEARGWRVRFLEAMQGRIETGMRGGLVLRNKATILESRNGYLGEAHRNHRTNDKQSEFPNNPAQTPEGRSPGGCL